MYAVGLTNTSSKDPESHTVRSASDLDVFLGVGWWGIGSCAVCAHPALDSTSGLGVGSRVEGPTGSRLDRHVTKYLAPSRDT